MDSFYNAEYIDLNISSYLNKTFDEGTGIDPAIYLKVLSVLIIRAGLFIAEVISIPSSNIQVLVLHNMIDLSVTFVGYGLIGFIFAFGDDFQSFIGIRGFINHDSDFNEFVHGWSILVIVSGLLTAAIGDRVSFFFGLVVNFLISSISFPLLFHWILHSKGWMRAMNFAGVNVSYKDYGHSCLVHMAGGYVSFLGMLVLNKRMLRFKDLDSSSIPDIGPNLSLFGYFLTLLGFVGYSIPTQKYIQTHLLLNFYGIILVNMIFSIVGTMVTTLIFTFLCPCRDRVSKWANLRFAQSGISGAAVIAAGVDVYHPIAAFVVGLFNGLIFFTEAQIVNKTNLEDFCNISAAHFFSGFLGTLLPPILGVREGFRTIPYNDFIHFSWQFICDATILTYLGVTFYPLIILFDRCGMLRTLEEEMNHKRAVSAMKLTPKRSLKKRLLDWDESNSYVDAIAKNKALTAESRDLRSDRVSVLFQNKNSSKVMETLKSAINGSGDENVKDASTAQLMYANYLTETKAFLPIFDQIGSTLAQTSDSLPKETGDNSPNNAKGFEMKMISGIRNISDSKLFNRLKESMGKTKSKKNSTESKSGLSSVSNMWIPSTSAMHFSLETEV